MDTRSAVEWRWVVVLLIFISAGMGWLIYQVPPSRLAGGFLLAIGVMNILLHRRFGKQAFRWGRSSRSTVARLWERAGEKGAQVLYLGIGIIVTTAGLVIWMRAVVSASANR